ncbi:MAG TPA: hypothetical protein VFV83_07805 [Chthoniobacteraceae bacterium]|nr:hypothetical protein [Chthoniobacteraceae bacterium]
MKPSPFQRLSASVIFGIFWGLFTCDAVDSGTQTPQNAQTTIRERSQQVLAIGKGERAAGQTEEVLRLHRTGSGLRIVGIRERKLE